MIWKHKEGGYWRWGLNIGGGKYYLRVAICIPLPRFKIRHGRISIFSVVIGFEYGWIVNSKRIIKRLIYPCYIKQYGLRRDMSYLYWDEGFSVNRTVPDVCL